jgi:hypothetical protein
MFLLRAALYCLQHIPSPHPPPLSDHQHHTNLSFTNPGCLSRILICIHSGSRISDPTTTRKRREKKVVVFFWSQNFHKDENNFTGTEKNLSQLTNNYSIFCPKNCHLALINMGWDPGAGIRKKPIPDSGSRSKKKHRIPDPDLQPCTPYVIQYSRALWKSAELTTLERNTSYPWTITHAWVSFLIYDMLSLQVRLPCTRVAYATGS